MMSTVNFCVPNLRRSKVDEQNGVYMQYTEFGSKTNQGGLKHMKFQNKHVRQYADSEAGERCVVHIFDTYLSYIPSRDDFFYYRPLADNGSGVPRFGKQPIGRIKLSRIIPDMCKAAGISGRKTGHSGKVTCATTLYQKGFSDQLIKERTGHRSLDALHKYKRTSSEQQFDVSMALLNKENVPCKPKGDFDDDNSDEDFKPLKKKVKSSNEQFQSMFSSASMKNCTFNFTLSK